VRIEDAQLYLVVDGRPDVVEPALRGGVDMVQLRIKDARDNELVPLARELRALCAEHDALFIVNDSPALAAAVDADGVHVGQDDASVADARRVVGPDKLVGLSVQRAEDLDGVAGADYLGVGPVFDTPTKPGPRGMGLGLVRAAAQSATVPWFAIGSIDETTIEAVVDAGATRVAVVRAIADAPDPEAAARRLRARLPGLRSRSGAPRTRP
jgi:thiamine-phosphate pyrophosphorylase